MSYFLGVKIQDLPTYSGTLANALIPVLDATTGDLYKIIASDVLIGSDLVLFPYTAAGGTIETITALHGKTILAIFRGSDFGGTIITTGTPGSFEIKWDNATDELTAPAGNDWLGSEILNIIHKA